jgi:hypothetical protein
MDHFPDAVAGVPRADFEPEEIAALKRGVQAWGSAFPVSVVRRADVAWARLSRPDTKPGLETSAVCCSHPLVPTLRVDWSRLEHGAAPAASYRDHAEDAPAELRSAIDSTLARWGVDRSAVTVQSHREPVAEVRLSHEPGTLWVGMRSGQVLAYRNRSMGWKRAARGLALTAVAFSGVPLLGPAAYLLLDPWTVHAGMIGATFGWLVSIGMGVVAVAHFASPGGGDGGASAWMKVR